jgi:hypothetical protein
LNNGFVYDSERKNRQMDCCKIKAFCTAKKKKAERQHIEWEKILARGRLISKIFNKLNSKKIVTQLKNGQLTLTDIS